MVVTSKFIILPSSTASNEGIITYEGVGGPTTAAAGPTGIGGDTTSAGTDGSVNSKITFNLVLFVLEDAGTAIRLKEFSRYFNPAPFVFKFAVYVPSGSKSAGFGVIKDKFPSRAFEITFCPSNIALDTSGSSVYTVTASVVSHSINTSCPSETTITSPSLTFLPFIFTESIFASTLTGGAPGTKAREGSLTVMSITCLFDVGA